MQPIVLSGAAPHSKRRFWQIVAIIVLNLLILGLLPRNTVTDTLSKMGSTGSEVRQIQTKLKNWGYYSGNVDGIFALRQKRPSFGFRRKTG